MFCRSTLSDSGTLIRVCSGIVRRMTCAIACPRVSFAAMPCVALSFNVSCADIVFQSLREIAYTSVLLPCMLAERAPCVSYESVDELVGLCAHVVEAYAEQVDVVVREIWNESFMTKKWSAYDRLILGIFCFDDEVVRGIEATLRSTKKRGAIYACLLHRDVCVQLNECTRNYIHSTQVPSRPELLTALRRVLMHSVLLGPASHMSRLLSQNFCRCMDAQGDIWLVCPRRKVAQYMLALCMSQQERLGREALLCEVPADVLRTIVSFLFTTTSWDLHPMDANVKVGVPA